MEEHGPKTVNEKSEQVYTDKASFGSLANTIKDVKRYYPEIKRADVEKWYKANVDYHIRQSGYNSFIASKALQEVQIDLFNMKVKEDDEYKIAIGAVDIFSNVATVIAVPDKKPETFLSALKHIFNIIGKPKIVMADQEGSLNSKLIDRFFKNEKVLYIANLNHAPYVERWIRTFRNMIFRRLQKRPDERWYNMILEVLLTYNRKMVHSATHMAPAEAAKKGNQSIVLMNLQSQNKHNKLYDEINVGDKVRLFRKRARIGETENIGQWSKVTYNVVNIEDNPDAGKLYYLSNRPTIPVLRSQILLVK